jgi:hypothetical protein
MGKDLPEDLAIDSVIILKCILRRWGGRRLDSYALVQGPLAGSREYSNV